jgi:hypothetical protein
MSQDITAREYQARHRGQILAELAGSDMMLEAPTGCGKTMLAVAVLADMLGPAFTHAIVIAPQTQIEDGFVDVAGSVRWPDGTTTEVADDLVRPARLMSDEKISQSILAYLRSPNPGYCLYFAKRHADETPKDLGGRVLVVDEAHHVSPRNGLGSAVDLWCGRGGRAFYLTATPYRADGAKVERAGMSSIRYSLPEHMEDGFAPRRLEHAVVSFGKAGDKVTGAQFTGAEITSDQETIRQVATGMVARWLEDDRPKLIVRVPPISGGSQPAILAIVAAFRAAGARVLDATGMKAGVKQAFRAAMKSERDLTPWTSAHDVVVGCQRVHEGTDWRHCSAVYSIGIPGSLGFVVQLLGRPMRQKPKGSKHADVSRMVFFVPCAGGEALSKLSLDHSRHAVMVSIFLADCRCRAGWIKTQAVRSGLGEVGENVTPGHGMNPETYAEVKLAMALRHAEGRGVTVGKLIRAAHKAYPDVPMSDLNFIAADILADDPSLGGDVARRIRRLVEVCPEIRADYSQEFDTVVAEFRDRQLGRSRSLEMLGEQLHEMTSGDMRGLANRLANRFGTDWSEGLILEKGEERKAKRGHYPNGNSGKIPDMVATWASADSWLRTRGSSLSRLFKTWSSIWSEELIRAKGQEWKAESGHYPRRGLGRISGLGATWATADFWLRTRGSSLSKFFGTRMDTGTWSEELIREKGEEWKAESGSYPNSKSGSIPGMDVTWAAANSWLRTRRSSLSMFFGAVPRIRTWSEELIREKGEEWNAIDGSYPTEASGQIPGMKATWKAANSWLHKRGSSLCRFFGTRNRKRKRASMNFRFWSEGLIRERCEEWKAERGSYPAQLSGQIPGMDVTWAAANAWLRTEGSSLYQFFKNPPPSAPAKPPRRRPKPRPRPLFSRHRPKRSD